MAPSCVLGALSIEVGRTQRLQYPVNVDIRSLRELLRPHIVGLYHYGHKQLPRICESLGLPQTGEGSRRERMEASFNALADAEVRMVATRYLEQYSPSCSVRNAVQEALWADQGPAIPKRFRREVAREMSADDLYEDANHFDSLLYSLWVLEDDPLGAIFGQGNSSLRAQIERHVHRNRGDWTPETLFDRLGAYDCSNRRFCLFLEGLASSEVRPDEAAQRRFAALVNKPLRRCGIELRETGTEGGYPVFSVTSLVAGAAGRPKNVIFASPEKPDLRFRDAVNNDIEIVTNADKVLVYDRAIGEGGLPWRDLQAWWAERSGGLTPDAAKKSLYKRLLASLPPSSPPQEFLFRTFFKICGKLAPNLPALLPEVWLHWDPRTVSQRGDRALPRFRMDFLLLFPGNHRIVIEVDGREHYADESHANPAKYGRMMAADRELRLAGYEVFRFGAAELDGSQTAVNMVEEFFKALFKMHGLSMRE